VKITPGSISFGRINVVTQMPGHSLVEIVSDESNKTMVTIKPDMDSLYAAFQEIGLQFGNDGRPEAAQTIDITGSRGQHAWPISAMVYLVLRTEYDHHQYDLSDSDLQIKNITALDLCMTRKGALLKFLEYVYMEQGYGSRLFNEGFAPMTVQAGAQVLELIRSRMKCQGNLVYKYPPPLPLVTIQVDESLQGVIGILGAAFKDKFAADLVITELESHTDIKDGFLCQGNNSCTNLYGNLVVLADENLSSYIARDDVLDNQYSLFSMPFCAMSTGFIYNFCSTLEKDCPYVYSEPLVLNLVIAAKILDLQIMFWNDSRIQALNPGKILPSFPINVISGPKTSGFHFDFIDKVRRSYAPSFAFVGGGSGLETYLETWIEVSLIPYSLSFVPFNGTTIEGVEKISLINSRGVITDPSPKNIEACARDTYDQTTDLFFMSSSQ
jgi:hypothetical protein